MMEHKITVESPHAYAPDPDKFASDPFYQNQLAHKAIYDLLRGPSEVNLDLRNAEISVRLHSDGLHATAELVETFADHTLEDLYEAAERIAERRGAKMGRMETIDLLERLGND